MKRRELLGLAALAAMAGVSGLIARPAWSQAAPFRIYMVTWRGLTNVEKGFKDYFAARKIPVEYIMRDAGQNPQRLAGFVEEIRQLRPDLVYTWGTSVTLGIAGPYNAHDAHDVRDARGGFIGDIPVVFALVASPVGARIVPSLDAPGRKLTGVSHIAPLASQLAAMRAYRPFKKIGVLYNAAEQNSVLGVQELKAIGLRENFAIIDRTFHRDAAGKPSAQGVAELVLELKRDGAEWLYIGPDSFLFTVLAEVTAAAAQVKLPSFASTEAVFESPAGVLAGLVSKYHSVGQFAAFKAEQILAGKVPPATIPVETLKRFSFLVRMSAARKFGMLPPVALFNYAEFL